MLDTLFQENPQLLDKFSIESAQSHLEQKFKGVDDINATLLNNWGTTLENLVLESLGSTNLLTRFQLHFYLLGGVIETSGLSINGKLLTVSEHPAPDIEET